MIKSIKDFIKKYWMIFLGFFGGFGAFFLLSSEKKEKPVTAKGVRGSGKQLSDDVDGAISSQNQQTAEEIKKHQAAMQALNEKYEALKQKLNDAEQAECDRILKDTKKNPLALAEELSKITGAKIILPEE
jgi:hypothetical protein